MRSLLTVFAALVVILGIVSGNLWIELRSARQTIADQQDQLAQARIPVPRAVQIQVPTPTAQAPATAGVVQQLPTSLPVLPLPQMLPMPPPRTPPPPTPVVTASVSQPLAGNTDYERRNDALMQSDRTATARVQAWSTVLNLTPEQLRALNATTAAELRRETEESFDIDRRNGTMDTQTAARVKVETVTRQHETLVRIHEKMAPQLTPEQSNRMRTMFDSWLRTNMARARADQERANMAGY